MVTLGLVEGKDLVGKIIQDLTDEHSFNQSYHKWEIKKFAGKLKQIASILTGIPQEKFEDQEFKKTLLGAEWGIVREIPLNSVKPFKDIQFNELMSVREFLQRLGTEAIRNGIHTNAWVNSLFADYKPTLVRRFNPKPCPEYGHIVEQYPNWIITDCRFPNEAQAIVERDGILIRVNRYTYEDNLYDIGASNILPKKHPSETSLDNWKFDYIIENNGTIEELTERVREILTKIKII